MIKNPTKTDLNWTKLNEAIEEASSRYFRIVILAGAHGAGKTMAMQSIARKTGYRIVNVNLELSKRMLEFARNQRSRQLERLLKEVIASTPGDVVLLDNLEILFDICLEVDPLRLLQVSSRNRTLVASWSGTYVSGTLTYAEPWHPEFVPFKQVDAVVLAIDGSAAC